MNDSPIPRWSTENKDWLKHAAEIRRMSTIGMPTLVWRDANGNVIVAVRVMNSEEYAAMETLDSIAEGGV